MPTNFKLSKASFLMVIFALVFTASLQAQSTDENADDESSTEHHELIKYEKTYELQQEQDQDSYTSTLTGIDRQVPGDIFLAANNTSSEQSELKKAEMPNDGEEEFDKYAFDSSYMEGDLAFSEDGDGDDGSSGFVGRTGPGCGVVF